MCWCRWSTTPAPTSAPPNPSMPRWSRGCWPTFENVQPASWTFQVPEDGADIFAYPNPKADIAERFLQAAPIPSAGSQVNRAVGAAAVAIFAPVLGGQRRDIDSGAAQVPQVRDRGRCFLVRQVLQDVIADDQVKGLPRCI